MTGLILKLSYNKIGDKNIVGGICGGFFFLQPKIAITAHHVLNREEFKPNLGFAKCQFWLIIQPNYIIELKSENLIKYSEIDTTVIEINQPFTGKIRKISSAAVTEETECHNEGFIAGEMPTINAHWEKQGLIISKINYNKNKANGVGSIKSTLPITISGNDVKLNNIWGYETSYGGVKGMSGGPLINKETDEIIGLMSIGLPPDLKFKKTIFAISITEIITRIL